MEQLALKSGLAEVVVVSRHCKHNVHQLCFYPLHTMTLGPKFVFQKDIQTLAEMQKKDRRHVKGAFASVAGIWLLLR